MRMTTVAASIGFADIRDCCLGIVMLGSEGGDEGILSLDCYSLRARLLPETYDV
jgi:hypothetical protein